MRGGWISRLVYLVGINPENFVFAVGTFNKCSLRRTGAIPFPIYDIWQKFSAMYFYTEPLASNR